jgi:muconolactone delta-isomerase
MNEYMIIIQFTAPFSKEFITLVPEQRAQINRLMEKGIITSYSLSTNRATLWITMFATSMEAVEITLRMMPLFKFMRYDIVELMFHNSPVYTHMHLSMN